MGQIPQIIGQFRLPNQALGLKEMSRDNGLVRLAARVRKQPGYCPDAETLVLFGIASHDDEQVALMIRFRSFEGQDAEGDHLYMNLEEAFSEALEDFGVARDDWRPLTEEEAFRIDESIKS